MMGKADECVPAAIVRELGLPVGDQVGVESIAAEACLFMGMLRRTGEK
jgi:F420-0:gamma-glutamyl ligase